MRRFAVPAAILFTAALAFGQATEAKPKSQAELQALQALFGAQDPDSRIKAADELLTKFADTDFKAQALEVEAEAYEAKQDHTKAIVYAEQALQADPKNFDAMTLLANVLAATTRDTDLDKEEKLKRADKYAHDAMDALKTTEKPNPQITDDQWAQFKKAAEAQAWQALGSSAAVRKKYDEAAADYQKALDLTPDPYIMIRAGRVMLAANKPDDAITWFDKAASAPNADARVKQIAAQDKSRATQVKNAHPAGSPAPGSPSTTPSTAPSTAPAPQQIQVKPPQP